MTTSWPEVPLGETAEIVSGITKGRRLGGQPVRSVPYLAVANVQDRHLRLTSVKSIEATEAEIERYRLQPGDLLLTEGGDPDKLGRGTIWSGELSECIHQNHVFRVRIHHPDLDPRFVNRLIASEQGRQYFLRSAKQTTGIASINKRQLAAFPLLKPPLEEQRKIVSILDAVDRLRAMRRRSFALLDSLTESIFFDMFGDPVTNPLGWPTVEFGDLLAMPLRNGVSPAKAGAVQAEVLTLSAVTGPEFNGTAIKSARFMTEPPAEKRVSALDLLICRGNGNKELVGRACQPTADMPGVAFPDTIIAARVDSGLAALKFTEQLWRTSATRRQLESMARTTNGTHKINQSMIQSVEVIAPPIERQLAFDAAVSTTHASRRTARIGTDGLDALVASLQHRAFQGEL